MPIPGVLVEATRFLNIAIYAVVFVFAVYGAVVSKDRARTTSAAFVAVAALAWGVFYAAISAGLWDLTNPSERDALTIISRFMHVLNVAAFLTYLNSLRVNEKLENAQRRAELQAAETLGSRRNARP